MKRIVTIILVASLFAGLGSCNYMKKKGWIKDKNSEMAAAARVDSIRADSLKRVEAQRMEAEKAAKEAADSADAAEKAKLQGFHVIIGSFKVGQYATSFAKEVETMGYKTTIVTSPNGFNLVSIGKYNNYSAAFKEIRRINEGSETPMEMWVYSAN
ncbi:MAG TPA: SPOR domain-containing protein [Williamwhitmania sp.]|nr:SPOR domain-containing protein [Williamwhitmania sp.]